jgi:hypothetical protein
MKRLLPILLLVFSVGVGAETIKYGDGSYTGEVKNGVPHGQGAYTGPVAPSTLVSGRPANNMATAP